jgi:hypothetical protein
MSGIAEVERRVGGSDETCRIGRPLLAPGYREVETTFWLRWRFGSVRLEETVD